jgi:vacuolar-type H+-ATPase subunit E/Vma4
MSREAELRVLNIISEAALTRRSENCAKSKKLVETVHSSTKEIL